MPLPRPAALPATARSFSLSSPTRSGANASPTTTKSPSSEVEIRGNKYETDPDWFNIPQHLFATTGRRLHLQQDHPVSITRQIIESNFPAPTFKTYNDLDPVVTTHQNFDSLGFPENHPGRALSDTYYINKTTLLRTHTSAHQAETFRKDASDGYLISADVYRRDAIDRSHYPAFHQMEGARSWDRRSTPDVVAAIRADIEALPKHDVIVEDPNPHHHAERNPVQEGHHTAAEADAVAIHLKRSLENMVVDIFTRAQTAGRTADPANFKDEPLRMRWVEAYFPFTSPSYELEVYYNGDWLEVLGCGVVKQDLYANAGVPHRLGWAFGIGLDRIAMLLFAIPDIRLFWSRDPRFHNQFEGVSADLARLRRFVPFSKYPPSPKDVSFWLPSTTTSAAGGNQKAALHENDVMEVVRQVAGDRAEDVRKFDEFTHPKTGRASQAWRITYRSLEKTLTTAEVVELHKEVSAALASQLGVQIRD